MNYELAQLLKSKLTGAVYVERIAGLVREVTKKSLIAEGKSILKTFPVACDLGEDCSSDAALKNLVPNAAYRSIIYFEDKGVVFSNKDAHKLEFVSSLQLTCWINLKQFKQGTCSLSGLIAADIVNRFDFGVINSGNYNRIQILKISELPKTNAIFSKYSYDDKNAYLIPPYDFFALLIETKFAVSPSCIEEITLENSIC